jgi:hypothetical protein
LLGKLFSQNISHPLSGGQTIRVTAMTAGAAAGNSVRMLSVWNLCKTQNMLHKMRLTLKDRLNIIDEINHSLDMRVSWNKSFLQRLQNATNFNAESCHVFSW